MQTTFTHDLLPIIPLKKQEYVRVCLDLDCDPHNNVPMIWRINGGGFLGLAHGARARDESFKFISIFIDCIFSCHSWKTKIMSPEQAYDEFLNDLLRVIFHEYTHHFIEPEFIGWEKTKIDPAANALVKSLFSPDNWDEWLSWWELFRDCYDFLSSEDKENESA